MIRDYDISNVRSVHTRARGILEEFQAAKDEHLGGVDAYLDAQMEYWDNWAKEVGRPHRYTREDFRDRWPHEWTAEDQAVIDNLTEVIRLLDQYAHPKNKMFPNGVV